MLYTVTSDWNSEDRSPNLKSKKTPRKAKFKDFHNNLPVQIYEKNYLRFDIIVSGLVWININSKFTVIPISKKKRFVEKIVYLYSAIHK